MTIDKAIVKLEVHSSPHESGLCTYGEHQQAKRLAIKCLKKFIKKKPVVEFSTHAIFDNDGNYLDQLDTTTFKCPVCDCILASGEIDIPNCIDIHYCGNCGQALEWSMGK